MRYNSHTFGLREVTRRYNEDTPGLAAGIEIYWQLADGEPFPDAFALEGEGCAYNAAVRL